MKPLNENVSLTLLCGFNYFFVVVSRTHEQYFWLQGAYLVISKEPVGTDSILLTANPISCTLTNAMVEIPGSNGSSSPFPAMKS